MGRRSKRNGPWNKKEIPDEELRRVEYATAAGYVTSLLIAYRAAYHFSIKYEFLYGFSLLLSCFVNCFG